MEGSASSSPPRCGVTTTSMYRTETVNGWHRFKLTGYSRVKRLGIGNYIASDVFKVGGHYWAVYVYPKGRTPEDLGSYASLYLVMASEGTEVRALFSVKLLDQSGNENHRQYGNLRRVPDNGPHTVKHRLNMWGFSRFIKTTDLEASEFLRDDCLQIECRVGVVKSHIESPRIYFIPAPPSNMGEQIRMLLESGKDTDVNFEVDGEIFGAHKLVLAARSPVFKAQFFGPLRDKNTGCIKVDEIMPPIFKALLHFIYCNTLPDIHELMGSNSRWVSTLVAQHLLVAADKYALDKLRLICEAKLCKSVTINTAASSLALADQHHCSQLKAVCLKFMASPENLRAVMETDEFEYLKEICPTLVTELLQKVADTFDERSVKVLADANLPCLDGNGDDIAGRRVKPRLSLV